MGLMKNRLENLKFRYKYLNKVICGDCLDVLPHIPANSIDLIFADPPYNMQIGYELTRPEDGSTVDSVTDEWDKFDSFQDYDKFTEVWLWECRRILKPTGSLWVSGTYHNIHRVGKILMDLGYWILNDITWIKVNPMPHFRGVRFCASTETMIWVAKDDKSRYTFNYHDIKAYNGGKQMRSDWYINICSGKERIKGSDGKKAHSTQKPEELLKRIILSSSKTGDIVLDPFFGTGTTGAVAKKLGRNYIGIDNREDYVQLAKERINAII